MKMSSLRAIATIAISALVSLQPLPGAFADGDTAPPAAAETPAAPPAEATAVPAVSAAAAERARDPPANAAGGMPEAIR